MRVRYKVAIVVLALFVVAYVVLFLPVGAPKLCAFTFDVAQARALTATTPGERPQAIRSEHVVDFAFPETAVRAGGEWRMVGMQVRAYQLNYSDRTIVVDTALDAAQAKESYGENFDAEAWGRVKQGIQTAAAVYVTHEHGDHMGGAFSSDERLYDKARLTPEQLAGDERLAPAVMPETAKATLKPLVYDGMIALAPGLVAIKAPGHTPGSQWFFVTKADGTEVLLAGDTAWHMSNIEHEQGPPRLVTLMLKNDRDANACQLMALHALQAAEPKVHIVPGHDGARMQSLERAGVITKGFTL